MLKFIGNCKLNSNIFKNNYLKTVKYCPDINKIKLYETSITACTKTINLQINFYPTTKYADFVCNQLCLEEPHNIYTVSSVINNVKKNTEKKSDN